MLKQLKISIARSGHLLLQDLVGASFLVMLLALGLHLPVLS